MFQFVSHRTFVISCLMTFYRLCFKLVVCEEVPVISDLSVIRISLKNYNVSDPDGESLEGKYILKPKTNCQIQITSIPPDVYFVVLQAHSYFKNITLSYNPEPTRQTSISGMNIGLVKMNDSPILYYHLLYDNPVESGKILIAVQAYGMNAPVPGGCNMEFQVETSPFLKTTFDDSVTKVDFAPASPSLPLLLDLAINKNTCNVVPDPVTYKLYRMYLPERNFSEELYFDSLKMMMTKSRILRNGKLIPDKTGMPPMRHLFVSYPGTGSVFVVIAKTIDASSVYVPSFTYSCHIEQEINDCRLLTTTFSKLLCAATFFLGLFSCFAAHRFFNIELLLLGSPFGGILFYIAAINLNFSAPLFSAVGIGLVCGIFFVIMWYIKGFPLFSLVISTCILGFLVSSSVFYKLVDLFDILQNDVNYWSLFLSVALLFPIILVSLAEKANIISCSVVGAYASVLSIDYYIGSNLRNIVLNTLRRATDPRLKKAITDPPFQTKDIVLVSVWILLAISGITIQLILMKGRPPYPAPSNLLKRLFDRVSKKKPPSERTPLLLSI